MGKSDTLNLILTFFMYPFIKNLNISKNMRTKALFIGTLYYRSHQLFRMLVEVNLT